MDYEDEDDQYRQYEDEMYKDVSEEGEDSDEIESDVEANLLGHIHYSSDLSKTLGMQNGAKTDTNTSESEGSPMAPFPGHLADPAPPAEDYFKSGHEQENGNEQVSRPLSSKHRLDDEDDEGDEEESRYSVPKKRDSKNTSQASPSKLDLSDGSDADSVADFEDSQGEEYEGSESDAIIDEVKHELQELQEHVIDMASLMNGTAPEVGDAPATDLTHLDDEKFKGRGRYYIEPEASRDRCYICGKTGHQQKNCTTTRCYVCGAIGEHSPDQCPEAMCYKCRRKGHISVNCPQPRNQGFSGCTECYSNDHVAEDCPTVWREYEYVPGKSANGDVVAYCYNCADVGHFGDDCNVRRPQYAQRTSSAFSSKNVKISSSSRSNDRDDYRSNDYSNDRDRRRDYDSRDRYDRDRDYDRRSDDTKRSRNRDQDRNRDRNRDRDRDRDRDRERQTEKAGEKYRSRNRDRDRDAENDRSYDDYRSRPSTSQTTSYNNNNAPTTATGSFQHPLPSRPTARPSSSRPSSRRNSPERISRPEGGARISFAEQNAFPRGGSSSRGPGANYGGDALIGVRQSDRNGPSQAGPLYTGGYSRQSIDPRARN